MPKVTLFCPAESTTPALNAVDSFDEVPYVGDFIYSYKLPPETGPGCHDHSFRVVERIWGTKPYPSLKVTHAKPNWLGLPSEDNYPTTDGET